jgi:hypothetical protein
MPRMWVADDLPFYEWESEPTQHRGDCYAAEAGAETYPDIQRPIGFMRRKPRVRVKAWTMPIIKGD